MNLQRSLFALTATAVALGAAPDARAFSIGGHLNETEFHNSGHEIALSAESRIGLPGYGEFELDIHGINDNGGFYNLDQDQFDWVSGEAVDFSLNFNSTAQLLTYTVGGVDLFANTVENAFSDLFVRTATRKAGSSMVVNNLKIKDGSTGGAFVDIAETAEFACTVAEECDSFWESSQYLHIDDVVGDFTLTGQSIMSWSPDNVPTRSQLAYQIKLIAGEAEAPTPTTAAIPEPTSAAAIAVIGGSLALWKRRRQA